MLLVALLAYEGVNLFRPLRTIDHAGHLGGMLVGVASAQMMEKREPKHGGDKHRSSPLHGAFYDLRDGVSAYLEGDQRKLQAAKKGRDGNMGGE